MIELRTFGALELTSTDGNVVRSVLAQPRRAALLCYLALASPRGFHRRDILLSLFWPENDAEQARHALRQSVYFLRRSLGPGAILSRGDGELSLDPGKVRCDVWEFEGALDAGRPADALALYQGELLAGFHISDAPDFERWLEAERSRVRERAREGAWVLSAMREQDGDTAGAAEAARRALALAATDETALRRLMVLLERLGDRAAALQAYEAFSARLGEEYELEPSGETRALVERIRAEPLRERAAVAAYPDGPPAGTVSDDRRSVLPQGDAFPSADVLTPPVVPSRSRPGRWRVAVAAVAVVLLILLSVIHYRRLDDSAAASVVPDGEPASAIAVLPFASREDSLSDWHEGLMDLVSMDLRGIPGIRPLESRTVLARWRELGGRERSPLATALQVAERAGGRYAVVGRVIAEGNDLLINADVYDVVGARMLGTARSQGPVDSIFTLVDQLTLEILRHIPGGGARDSVRLNFARVNTSSLPALRAFLEGEVQFRRSQFENAAKAYGRAVEFDSTFGLARYRLGVSLQWYWGDILGTYPDPLVPTIGRFANRLPSHEAAMLRAFVLRDQDVLAARALLEEEVKRHPDDADTWYELGELYHHAGNRVPVPVDAGDRALARAIALDSTFSLPYIHRIEFAVSERDSATAYRLLRTFASLAPGTRHLSQLRLLTDLVLGDSTRRAASRSALDTLDVHRLAWLGFQFAAAHRWDLSDRMFRLARARGEAPAEAVVPLFYTSIAQGKVGAALRWLDDPAMPESRRAAMLQSLIEAGVPTSAGARDSELPLDAADTVAAFQLFYLGALAASRGQWEVARSWEQKLQSRARRLRAAGDSAGAGMVEGMQEGVEGYRWWRQGQRERALPLLQRAQRRALCCPAPAVNDRLRWWLGGLLAEMERPRESVAWFESVKDTFLPADYELGRLYEQLGMNEAAREAYGRFLATWAEADALLQPKISDARTALDRLTRAGR